MKCYDPCFGRGRGSIGASFLVKVHCNATFLVKVHCNATFLVKVHCNVTFLVKGALSAYPMLLFTSGNVLKNQSRVTGLLTFHSSEK